MSDLKRERCTRCQELYTEREMEDMTECTFLETRLEPAEYEARCPCGSTDFEEFYICEVLGCEREATEDDLCSKHFARMITEQQDPGTAVDFAEYMMEDR